VSLLVATIGTVFSASSLRKSEPFSLCPSSLNPTCALRCAHTKIRFRSDEYRSSTYAFCFLPVLPATCVPVFSDGNLDLGCASCSHGIPYPMLEIAGDRAPRSCKVSAAGRQPGPVYISQHYTCKILRSHAPLAEIAMPNDHTLRRAWDMGFYDSCWARNRVTPLTPHSSTRGLSCTKRLT
jgi:hypothetical protein